MARIAGLAILFMAALISCKKTEPSTVTPEPHQSIVQWAKDVGTDEGAQTPTGVGVDGAGNSVAVGNFGGGARFDSVYLNASGSSVFIVKYNPDGIVVWAQKSLSTGMSSANGVSVDFAGNIALTGSFHSSVTIGGLTINTGSTSRFFLYKLDPSGNAVWARAPEVTSTCYAAKPSIDNAGNTFVAGEFAGTITLDTATMTAAGSWAAFFAKYDPAGNLLWARGSKLSGYASATAIGADSKGATYGAGVFTGVVSFANVVLATDSLTSGFLIRLDSAGNVSWAKKIISPGAPYDMAVDPEGNSYLVGTFDSYADLGATSLSGGSSAALFLVSYDSEGNLRWARSLGGYSSSRPRIGLNARGNCFVTGGFYQSMNLGTIAFSSTLGDFFVCECTSSGQFSWARRFGGSIAASFGHGVAADHSNQCFVIGVYQRDLDLDGIKLNSKGGTAFFIAKLLAQ